MPDEPVEHQPPDVLAMILAENILQELATNKFYIQGTFSHIYAKEFPAVYWLNVYLALTDGHGRTEIKIRLVDVDEASDPILEHALMVDFRDPLQVVETVFAIRGVQFPAPGEYRIQVFGAGQPLRERRLQVIPAPGAEPHESGE